MPTTAPTVKPTTASASVDRLVGRYWPRLWPLPWKGWPKAATTSHTCGSCRSVANQISSGGCHSQPP